MVVQGVGVLEPVIFNFLKRIRNMYFAFASSEMSLLPVASKTTPVSDAVLRQPNDAYCATTLYTSQIASKTLTLHRVKREHWKLLHTINWVI